jgi:uncharacterized protein
MLALPSMPEFKISGDYVTFWLRVRPRASRERLVADSSGELCLHLHAPATEGQANEACIHFFARQLRVPLTCVSIVSGHRARRKLLRITGRAPEETVAQIQRALATEK